MTTIGVQRRLLAVFLVFTTLVTLSNAILKDEEAPFAGLSVRVSGYAWFSAFTVNSVAHLEFVLWTHRSLSYNHARWSRN